MAVGERINFPNPEALVTLSVAARRLAATVRTDSPQALRDVLRRTADLGADELHLVPTTADPDEVARVADLIG